MKDFLVWSWKDKKFNRNILVSAILSFVVMAGICTRIMTGPSLVANVQQTHTETAYIQLR